MDLKLFKRAIIKTLPVMAGYLVMGMAFGILLRVNGYSTFYALFMSVFIYAGSMQFVGISLIVSKASFLSAAITTLLVNARHLFYGISLIERYKGAGLKKLYLMHALTDETYSLVCSDVFPNDKNAHKYYFLISLFNHIYWITGCVTGAFLGSLINFDTTGLDFVMTALFVTIFVDQWKTTKEHRPALIGAAATVISLIIFGKDNFLIPAMLFIIIILTLIRKKLEKGDSNE